MAPTRVPYDLDIVIVNWNAGDLLADCVRSLLEVRNDSCPHIHIIVVDNDSSDDSLAAISGLDPDVSILHNEANLGFAAACNIGANAGSAPMLLFLNPDAKMFPNTLERACDTLRGGEQQGIGIVGVQLLDDNGHVAKTCSRFPQLHHWCVKALGLERMLQHRGLTQAMREWSHQETRFVDQVMGAFFLIRRSLFTQLRGFDERFFVYFEEVDLAYRAALAGSRSYFLSDVQAYHKGCGTSERVKAHRLFYSLRSRVLYGFKHFNLLAAWTGLLVTLVVEPLSRGARQILRRDFAGLRDTLRGVGWLWADLPNWLPTALAMRRSG